MLKLVISLAFVIFFTGPDPYLVAMAWWHDAGQRIQFYLPHPAQMSLLEQAGRADLEYYVWSSCQATLEDRDTYIGMKAFGADDIVSNFFANIRQLVCRRLYEWGGPHYQWRLIMICFSLFPVKRRIAKSARNCAIA